MQPISFEQACEFFGYDPNKVLPDVSMFPVEHQKAATATHKLMIIHDAYNEKKKVDWNNQKQRKWRGWWDMEQHPTRNPSGFRFYGSYYVYTDTFSTGGSRLCFLREEDLLHAAKHHLELFRDMMVITQ